MADPLSDSEFGSSPPAESGIQLVKHARTTSDGPHDNFDDNLQMNSLEGDMPNEDGNGPDILPPEIKMEAEISQEAEQGIDLDAILDELESVTQPALTESSMISSTIPDASSLDDQDVPLNLSTERDKVTSSSLIPGDDTGRAPTVPFQDLAISSSLRDSPLSHLHENAEEDNSQVSSTTNVMVISPPDEMPSPSPHQRNVPSLGKRNPVLGSGKKHKYMCNHCDFTATSYSTLYGHFKRLHPKILKMGKLASHYSKSIGPPNKKKVPTLYACQHCNYITLSLNGFTIHSRRLHPRRKANPLKQGSPITSSVNRKYLEALYRSGDGPPKNQEKIRRLLVAYHRDSKVLRAEHSPRLSPRKSQKKYTQFVCIICDKEFPMRSRLNEHYRLSHPEQGPKKNLKTGLFHCKLCPHDSMSKTALRRHYSRSHFMDAFYAWNVPFLEEQLKARDQNMREKAWENEDGIVGEPVADAPHGKLLEKMDAFMNSTVQWRIEQTTEEQSAESRIPCILCDFSTENVVCLMLHYQTKHDGYYPRGFKALLLQGLVAHTCAVDVPEADLALMNGIDGAWLDENEKVTRLYKFACQLCIFKCEKFQDMSDHFTKLHPDVNNCASYIKPLDPSYDSDVAEKLQNDSKVSAETTHYFCNWCEYHADECAMRLHYVQCHSSHAFDLDNLRSEVVSKKSEEHTCFACEYRSSNNIDLAFHYQRQHFYQAMTFTTPTRDDGYQCLLCMAITPSLAGMIRHERKHCWKEGDIPCDDKCRVLNCPYCKHCRSIFASPQHLWCHITRQHVQFSRLISVSDLPMHVVKFGFWKEEEMPCLPQVLLKRQLPFKQNTLTFADGNVAERKSQRFAKFDSSRRSSPYRCNKCPQVFNSREEYINHSCKPTQARRSTACRASPGTRAAEARGYKVRCKFCSLTTTHPQNMRRHLQAVHRHDVSYRCFKCVDETTSITDCLRHHQHIHGLNVNRQAAHNFLLNDIVMITEGHGKFMCAWCGYRGLSRMSVHNHFNSRHICSTASVKHLRKGSKFWCKWCDYYTRNAASMRAHAQTRHNRMVAYHSLRTFRSYESVSSESTDESDEDYRPTKNDKRFPHLSPSSRNASFALVEDCAFSVDSDLSDDEVYRSTHERCKHQIRYPHVCKFCMKAFVCSTKFLRHCITDHCNWCSVASCQKNIFVIPDPKAVVSMHMKISEHHDREYSKSVFHNSAWQCELCRDNPFESLLDLQEHVWAVHNGKKIFMCKYCEFLSFDNKRAALHGHQHHQRIQQNLHHSSRKSLIVEKDGALEDETLVDFADSNVYNGYSDMEILSDHDNLPDLNPVSRLKDDSFDTPHKRARKSIRGNAPVVQALEVAGKQEDSMVEEEEVAKDVEDDMQIVASPDGVNMHFLHSVCHSGIIRCNKCDFVCTDSERMGSHIKSSHLSMKQYACKFCEFISDGFASLDDHLAEFHKIKRNHQLGLQMRYAMQSSSTTTEEAIRSISEMRSRFLYTPTPSLPIIRAEVKYLPPSPEAVVAKDDVDVGDDMMDNQSSSNMHDDVEAEVVEVQRSPVAKRVVFRSESIERFKCSYCGHVADSTLTLELHMKRHEGNFQQDFDSVDSMGYCMNKTDMVHTFP